MTTKDIFPVILTIVLVGAGWTAANGIWMNGSATRGGGLAAQASPDFSGTWVLDVYASEFAGERPPQSKVQRVEQKGTDLTVTIDEINDRGTVHGVARYTTDGQDAVNDVLGFPMTSSISWEGTVMIMRTWGKFGGADIMLIDRWALSPDGKRLTIARRFQGRGRVVDQTLIFERKLT